VNASDLPIEIPADAIRDFCRRHRIRRLSLSGSGKMVPVPIFHRVEAAVHRLPALTEICSYGTFFCMRTTLDIDERLLRQAKARAAERGETLTRFLEGALRDRLTAPSAPPRPFRFRPLVKRGTPLPGIDLDDRDALYERMEGRG
jgi:hypothetical protein